MRTSHFPALLAVFFATGSVVACASAHAPPAATSPAAAAEAVSTDAVSPPLDCPSVASMAPADRDALVGTVLAGRHRSAAHRARDVYRHPQQTLAFMGVTPSLDVVELWPGGGWYTEVLAPLLRDCGHLTSVGAPTGPDYAHQLAAAPAIYGKVSVVDVEPEKPAPFSLAKDGSVDIVLTFRNVHNWVAAGYEARIYEAAFRALKPGGTFGVVEHRAQKGTDEATSAKTGYVDEEALIARIQKAGFVLEEKSEINANPKDSKDYPGGVWTLPPSLALGDVDKAKYLAIGESDRMTLRFKKPR